MFKKKCSSNESGFSMMELSVGLTAAFALVASLTSTPGNFLAAGINDLEDVFAGEPTVGETLVFDGTNWVSQRLAPGFLSDMQLSIVPGVGDVIMYDNGRWVNRAPTPPSLAGLANVSVSSSAAGDSLIWNGQQWTNGNGGIPGEITILASSGAPDGWLIADGRAVSRTTYAALFAAIGTTYGSGDGSTTFNLPDFRSNTPVGLDSRDNDFNTLGATGGEKEVTLTEEQLPVHTHTQQPHSHTGSTSSAGAHTHTGSTSTAGAHTHTGTWSGGPNHNHSFGDMTTTDGTNTGDGTSHSVVNNVMCCDPTSASGGAHTHGIASVSTAGAHTHSVDSVSTSGAHTHTLTVNSTTAVNNPTGGGQPHNNMQPYIIVNFAIKY